MNKRLNYRLFFYIGLILLSGFALILLILPTFILLIQSSASNIIEGLDFNIVLEAIWLSLRTSAISMAIILITGTPLAYILTRWEFRGRQLLHTLVTLPIVMPPAVAGVALILTFGRNGFIGALLSQWGITLPFSEAAVVIAQVFVAMPFYIRTTQTGFASVSKEIEDAARVDGAEGLTLLRHITLPIARRGLVAGLVLAWARALGEFGATLLFAGNLQGRTQTMPLLIFTVFTTNIDAAVFVAIILIMMAFVALLISQWLLKDNAPQEIF